MGPHTCGRREMKHTNRWDTLEEKVNDRKVVKQVWDVFENSFEQSTSFWHFQRRLSGRLQTRRIRDNG